MTKPLDPDEKARRAEEREAIKAGAKAGKTAAQVMTELGRQRIAEAKRVLEAQDAVEEPKRAAERERARIEHETRMEEQRRADTEAETRREAARQKAEADAAAKAAQTPKIAASRSRGGKNSILRSPGYARCPGSTLNVEENELVLLNGRLLRDEDPWNYRGKRVTCPSCGHSVGVSPFGKRKEAPVGFKIDTHYKKA